MTLKILGIIKSLVFGFLMILSLVVIWINVRLYSENFSKDEKRTDIASQLAFIGSEMRTKNMGIEMQGLFPEGFVFSNALYGLAWCELGLSDPTNNLVKNKAIYEALWAYNEIDSETGKAVFDENLVPSYGIYYVGWKNYLLSKILALDTTFAEYQKYKQLFLNDCKAINDAVDQSESPYLPSYNNQTWPADICVAMASLKNHDDLFEPKYLNQINNWIDKVKTKLDPVTSMVPHSTETLSGLTMEGTRGSSISLIIRFLSEIDTDFASEQFALYKSNFVTTQFGLPAVREYPNGQSGSGDIDSGPVIFGVGFSGTIVSIGTIAKLGDLALAERQFKTINAFGFPFKTSIGKRYIFGILPIADAFIAWGRASALNSEVTNESDDKYWRFAFHIISLFLLVVLWALFYAKSILSKFAITSH